MEDNAATRKLLIQALLKDNDIAVVASDSGLDGLDKLKSETGIDAVILDWVLPDMMGNVFLEQCHLIAPSIPVIVLTGHPSVNDAQFALSGGSTARAVAYLSKPVSITILKTELDKHVRFFRICDWTVSLIQQQVYYAGTEISLSPLEYKLMLLFLRNADTQVDYETIYLSVRGESAGSYEAAKQSVASLVSRLSQKLQDAADYRCIVSTRQGSHVFHRQPHEKPKKGNLLVKT